MLPIHTSSLRGTLNETAPPPASGGGSSDPAGFSSLLRQSQAAAAPVAPTVVAPKAAAPAMRDDTATRAPQHEPAHASDTEAPADTDEAMSNDVASRSRAGLKPRLRSDATPRAARPASDAAGSEKNKLTDKAGADAAATAATTAGGHAPAAPVDPAIAQWLAALQRPANAAATGDADSPATDSVAPALSDATGMSGKARIGDDTAAAGIDPKDKSAHGASRFAATADTAGLVASGTEARQADTTSEPISHAVTSANSTSAASLQPAPGSAREAAAPVAVALATPVNAPDFAQALGLQLSVLTKDGVQRAELHLNPAEMGPVSVQIVMDGTQARIDFGADVAATRSAIEAGLPELASALRDAGFTLAGGGVSQHSSPRGDGSSGQPDGRSPQHARHRVTDDSVARVGAAARRIVTAGGLDLYA